MSDEPKFNTPDELKAVIGLYEERLFLLIKEVAAGDRSPANPGTIKHLSDDLGILRARLADAAYHERMAELNAEEEKDLP